jgi:hypothetical protein
MTPDDLAAIPATPAELAELARSHAEWVSTCLAPGDSRCWRPSLMVLTRTSGIHVYVLDVPFNEGAEKRAAMTRIGRELFAAREVPAAAVMSAEAWGAPDRAGGVEPRHHPDRVEVITLAGSTVGGRHALMQRMVIGRDPAGLILPGPWNAPSTEGVEPRLLNQLWAGYFEHVIRKFGRPE